MKEKKVGAPNFALLKKYVSETSKDCCSFMLFLIVCLYLKFKLKQNAAGVERWVQKDSCRLAGWQARLATLASSNTPGQGFVCSGLRFKRGLENELTTNVDIDRTQKFVLTNNVHFSPNPT